MMYIKIFKIINDNVKTSMKLKPAYSIVKRPHLD